MLSGPQYVARLDESIFEGAINHRLSGFWRRHKSKFAYIVPLGYTLLVARCLEIFYTGYYALLGTGLQKSILVPAFSILPIITFVACIVVGPGQITKQNHTAVMNHFQYDRIIFMPGSECSTCKFEKPARSKHCSECGHCHMLADHHCIITNNCVGYGNYRYFLAFLLANFAMLLYGAVILHRLISRYIQVLLLDGSRPLAHIVDPGLFQWRYWRYVLRSTHYHNAVGLFALCIPLTPVVAGFLGVHLRYIYLGATTNEVSKWEMINDCIEEGTLYFYADASPRTVTDSNSQPTIVLQKLADGSFNRPLTPAETLRVRQNNLQLQQVKDHGDIVNIYDHGFWNNLKLHLFPKPIR